MLQNIRSHADLISLNASQREQLCSEIREFLVDHVSRTGGHLASNLGVVELTVALETVFDTASDRLVFDVGHQSYVHKILTGRQAAFSSLRKFEGMAGFPKPKESDCDAFTAGHASSSVSIALGMARARTLSGEDYQVIALMGDGAATGGMAYEGLNDAGVSGEPMIVVLNDNAMSIDHNVGGMASHLGILRTKHRYLVMKRRYKQFLSKIPGGDAVFRFTRSIKDSLRRMLIPTTMFEDMGFTYLGPVDGHDTENLISLLHIAKEAKRPVLLHVITRKGKGYAPAQEHPKLFHGVGKFDPVTGEVFSKNSETFSSSFGEAITALAKTEPRLCAITAAMPGGTGLLDFKKQYPRRFFDVGIAEEHAVSMAGGLAKQGMIPVVALYSTFLQRSYDQIMHDVALQGLHVVFAVDRAGLVGEDGETHHGIYDVGFLRQIPGMSVLAPACTEELKNMLSWAVKCCSGPVALRYPRGGNGALRESRWEPMGGCPVCTHIPEGNIALVTYGTICNSCLQSAEELAQEGMDFRVVRILRLNPLPVQELSEALAGCKRVIVVEEAADGSGLRESIACALMEKDPALGVQGIDLGKDFVPHGTIEELYKSKGMD
ncbi:MAG: 1-deoxy-D-xylulose-5-phosphate synthase, partial [Oscillospiraceae bacterium]|nr:1-deoxy-D-xylulose-5-phosphate synthase [Oscillospiraceae bacterium]